MITLMISDNGEFLLHREDMEPLLIYRYSPVRSLKIMTGFLSICVVICIVMMSRARGISIVLGIFSVILLFKLLKTCSIRIFLDWPNLVYSYRSIFKNIDATIPSWEITGISPEITSMWRGNISERLVLEAGGGKFVITPFHSSSDLRITRFMEIVRNLPATRKQALYEIDLQRRVREGENGVSEEDKSSEVTV